MIDSVYSKLLDLPFQSEFLLRLFALQLKFRNSLSHLITELFRSSLPFSMDISSLHLAATFAFTFMSSSGCILPWRNTSSTTTTWLVAEDGMRKITSWVWVNCLCWWLRSLGKWLWLPGWPIGTLGSSSLFTKAISVLHSVLLAFKIRFLLGKSII